MADSTWQATKLARPGLTRYMFLPFFVIRDGSGRFRGKPAALKRRQQGPSRSARRLFF